MTKKKNETGNLKTVQNEEKTEFKITPEVMNDLLNGKLKSGERTVDYLIDQLILTKQQFDQLVPRVKQVEQDLQKMHKNLDGLQVRFEALHMDICNLWPTEGEPILRES